MLPSNSLKAADLVRSVAGPLLMIGLFSGVINILMLSGAIYMLQVYDRVLPSGSVPTLIALTAILLFAFTIQGVVDVIRQRMLTRVGSRIDMALSSRVHALTIDLKLRGVKPSDLAQPGKDLESIRTFFSGLGPTALFDFPWMFLYIGLCYILHPYLGALALVGALLLAVITIITELVMRRPQSRTASLWRDRQSLATQLQRNSEIIEALGMRRRALNAIDRNNVAYLASLETSSDRSATLGTISKMLRYFLQSAILGLGAWLVIMGQASPGVMIAASIMLGRALAPVEIGIAHWNSFVAARVGWSRLKRLIDEVAEPGAPMGLPRPQKSLGVDGVFVVPPGGREAVVQGVSFNLLAGQALAIIGPSASGKSTLSRVLCGVWKPARGTLRFDGAELSQWSAGERGAFIGYLPQQIELFSGSVAENIARLMPDFDRDAVVAAARLAGAHDMIVKLPDGYDFEVGEDGAFLSAGQRQRIALARAFFGNPFLVVLDEPNANLDAEGEMALSNAIRVGKENGTIVIVIAHRPSALAHVDLVMVMNEGRMNAFGPRDDILKRVAPQTASSQLRPTGLSAVGEEATSRTRTERAAVAGQTA